MIRPRRKILTIRIPEGVEFSFTLAGPVSRLMAVIIDFMVKWGMLYGFMKVATLFKIVSHDVASSIVIIGYFIISSGYAILFEWYWNGQTIGKRMFRLRVMDAQGLRLHFSQIVIRSLLQVVDMIPMFYLVGGVSCFASAKSQRLGDLAANTIVVSTPKILQPDLSQLLKDKYNSLRRYPHLCSRLRHNISAEEAQLAMQALMRREDFDPQNRIELFDDIAGYFKGKVPFPDEAVENVSAEQYVRNIVDILFSSHAASSR